MDFHSLKNLSLTGYSFKCYLLTRASGEDYGQLADTPTLCCRFRSLNGEALLRSIAVELLADKIYSSEENLANNVAKVITERLKGLDLSHYKYIVQVTMGEQYGQGLNIASQCVWDADCDGMAKYFYTNVRRFDIF
nr:Tctex-1 domain containing protein [Haemonchus contortus]